jgi:hypothetical protein
LVALLVVVMEVMEMMTMMIMTVIQLGGPHIFLDVVKKRKILPCGE